MAERKEDGNSNTFDLEPFMSICHELIQHANIMVHTVFNRKDYKLVDEIFGGVAVKEGWKAKELSASLHPEDTIRDMVQKLLAGSIRNLFPHITVCGEDGTVEYTPHDIVLPRTSSSFVQTFKCKKEFPPGYKKLIAKDVAIWIDPLDGEREFFLQHDAHPEAATISIGVAYQGTPIAAIVGRPFVEKEEHRIVWGIVGVGAFGYDDKTRPFDKQTKHQILVASRSDVSDIWKEYVKVVDGYSFGLTYGTVGHFLMVLEGAAHCIVFPLMHSTKYQTCAGEALIRSFGGNVTRPDKTRYDYSKNAPIYNRQGFIASIRSDEQHARLCHSNVDIEQSDLMLIGATGFTGRLAAEYIVSKYGKDEDCKFAIAGRKLDSLNKLKKDLGKIDDDAANRLKTYAIDVKSATSVEKVLPHAAVVISTVGPYAKYGDKLMYQVSRLGTDYADITGEVTWAKKMYQRHDIHHSRSESRAVHFCGLVSFPFDACTYIAVKQLRDKHGVVPEDDTIDIQTFLSTKGMQASGGTMESWFYSFSETSNADLTDPYFLFTENEKKPTTKQPSPGLPVWLPQYKAYGHMGMYSLLDRMILNRTNYLLDNYYGTNARIHPTKWLTNSWLVAWGITLMMMILQFALKFSITRLLLKLLRVCFIKPGEGPSQDTMLKAKAQFRVVAKSQKTKKAVEVIFTTNGDAGYLHTSKFLVEHGMYMVNQRKGATRVKKGGFLTPAGLAKDAIIRKLAEEKEFELKVTDL